MKKTVLLGIVLALALGPGLMAQTAGTIGASTPSMKNTATGGLWGNDMDNVQDVNDWQDVEFDKFFGFLAGGGWNNNNIPFVSGGFAKNFGPLYLGIFYSGSLVSGSTVEEVDAAGDRADAPATDNGLTFTDTLYILAGTPVGGFKLGILSNFRTDEDKDDAAGKTEEKDGRLGLGLIWGKNFEVGPGILKPEAGILYGFNLSETKVTNTAGDSVTTRGGYAPLQFLLRGDYVFPENGGRQSVISLSDVFEYQIFPDPLQENSVSDFTMNRTGKAWNNNVTLGFKRTYEIDEKFSVAWNVQGNFYYSSENTDQETKNPDTEIDGDTTTFVLLVPSARLGFVYHFVPDRFDLYGYAGAQFHFERIKESANADNDDSSTTTTRLSGLQPLVGLGGTLQIHPMAAFDFSLNASTSPGGRFVISPTVTASVIIRN
ncbi:MAG: hypothetical protein LBC31_04055 [Treponema sp.]|jgi:hypothetical protein|nr:hypothetical protein [Treponema sp.]